MRLEGIAELGDWFHFARIQRIYAGAENLPRNPSPHILKRSVELQVIACDTRAEKITGKGIVREIEDNGSNLSRPKAFPYPLLIAEAAAGNSATELDRLYAAQIAISKDCQNSGGAGVRVAAHHVGTGNVRAEELAAPFPFDVY